MVDEAMMTVIIMMDVMMGLVMMTTLGSLMTAMAMAEVNIQPKVTWQPT